MPGFDPNTIQPRAEYTLRELSDFCPFTVAKLRTEIKTERLVARRKGKLYLVTGEEFLRWWHSP